MKAEKTRMLVTTADYERLREKLKPHQRSTREPQWTLVALLEELEEADLVLPEQIPPDVVTMNSTVRIIAGGRGEDVYTIVYPEDAQPDGGRISILSPVAIALFGRRAGEEIERLTPAGPRRFKVKAVLFQPEAAKQWQL